MLFEAILAQDGDIFLKQKIARVVWGWTFSSHPVRFVFVALLTLPRTDLLLLADAQLESKVGTVGRSPTLPLLFLVMESRFRLGATCPASGHTSGLVQDPHGDTVLLGKGHGNEMRGEVCWRFWERFSCLKRDRKEEKVLSTLVTSFPLLSREDCGLHQPFWRAQQEGSENRGGGDSVCWCHWASK